MRFQFADARRLQEMLQDDILRLEPTSAEEPDPARDRAPMYRFAILRKADGTAVGRCDLRVGMNPSLYYSGNIGYHIYEKHRGNGYAERAARLLLKLAVFHRMPQVVLTCRPGNLPSRRICEKLGARLTGIVPVPSSHELYEAGDREECRYVLWLE